MYEKTVIISCAGMGLRLGHNIPKCLSLIGGKTLLELQLEQLKDVKDVRIVVGYKKDLVLEVLKKLNLSNVSIYENSNYENTGTAGSFCCAIDDTICENIIALDGDVLVNPEDMSHLLHSDDEFICGGIINTNDPVLLSVDDLGRVCSFSRITGEYEWAGVAQIKRDNIIFSSNHVYQLLEKNLPMNFKFIRFKEIDTPEDLAEAQMWYQDNYSQEKAIVDNWFKSRFSISDSYEMVRYRLNDRIDYDEAFIRRFLNPTSRVLDLGCGTGIIESRISQYSGFIKGVDKYPEFLEKAPKLPNVEYAACDVAAYWDKSDYDLILLWGVSIYLLDSEMDALIANVSNMMLTQDSAFIIKNQWSMSSEDYIVNKKYSNENDNDYYGIYRSLERMRLLLELRGFFVETVDIYPPRLNLYDNTHEYAIVCRKRIK